MILNKLRGVPPLLQSSFRIFPSIPRISGNLFCSQSLASPRQSTDALSGCVSFAFSEHFIQRKSYIFCDCPFSLRIICPFTLRMFEVYPCGTIFQVPHSFLLPSNSPLCGWNSFCSSIHQLVNMWVVSSFLAVMTKAAGNSLVQVFVWMYVFLSLGRVLGVELLGCMIGLCLTF